MNSANKYYVENGRDIIENGFDVNTRGTCSKESVADIERFELSEPLVVTLASRKLKPSYVIDEFKWYMSGSLQVDDISKSAPFWDKLKDEHGEVVSNYGYWLFHEHVFFENDRKYKSRFDNCVDILVADPYSRKAIINIHGVDNSQINPKDTPCTLSIQFLIREDELYMIVNMRSNDLVLGWCNDILQFQFIAWMMFAVLKHRHGFKDLKLGIYTHFAGSLHIYDRHFDKPEFNGKEIDLLSPAAVNFRFGLERALERISDHIPRDLHLSNLGWLHNYIVPHILDYQNYVDPLIIDYGVLNNEQLVDLGAFPLDEGI